MRLVWVSFDVMGRDCLVAAAEAGAEVAAVVTLPGPIDASRSGQCSFDEIAVELGAKLIETADVNSPATVEAVREVDPDLIFIVGWSQLVMDEFIGLARHGVFGMHPTLLPKHRGRAAIPWAILSGLAKTGVTLFEIVDGTADSGPIVGQVEVPLARDETATTLYDKVTAAHVELVRACVPQLDLRGHRHGESWPVGRAQRPAEYVVEPKLMISGSNGRVPPPTGTAGRFTMRAGGTRYCGPDPRLPLTNSDTHLEGSVTSRYAAVGGPNHVVSASGSPVG